MFFCGARKKLGGWGGLKTPYATDSLLANSTPLQNQPLGKPHFTHRHNFCTNDAIQKWFLWGKHPVNISAF